MRCGTVFLGILFSTLGLRNRDKPLPRGTRGGANAHFVILKLVLGVDKVYHSPFLFPAGHSELYMQTLQPNRSRASLIHCHIRVQLKL